MKTISASSFLKKVIRIHKTYLIALFCIAVSYSLLSNIQAYTGKKIIDLARIHSETNIALLQYWLIISIGTSILFFITIRGYDFFSKSFYIKGITTIELMLTEHLLQHPFSFYQKHLSGTMASSITHVSEGCLKVLKFIMNDLIAPFFMTLCTLYSFYHIHYTFALLLLIWFVFSMTISTWLIVRNRVVFTKAARARTLVKGHLVDTFSNITTVRLFNGTQTELNHVNQKIQDSNKHARERDSFLFTLNTIQGCLFLFFQITSVTWLYNGLIAQTLSSGDAIIIFTLSLALISMLWGFGKHLYEACEQWGAINQGLQLIYTPHEKVEQKNQKPLCLTNGKILFKNVTFSYTPEKKLFDNLSITIPAQQKIGLVGFSGSGKSTFINLILKLYTVKQGTIVVDDQNINDITTVSLYEKIGVIPQEPILFSRSIADNISYPHTNISQEKIIAAAKQAYAHEFIMELPQGYNTTVGERGTQLSGGQRQRIAIARAIFKNAPILFLDEATSQLDSASEAVIQDALLHVMHHKTVIAIAHRLSTLLRMDRILVFKNGHIVEDGTHFSLLQQGGIYAHLWKTQTGHFVEDVTSQSAKNSDDTVQLKN